MAQDSVKVRLAEVVQPLAAEGVTQDSVTVLLVEDSNADARLAEILLAQSGAIRFCIDRVGQLSAALQRLAHGRVDVVLLDLNLPDSEGLHTLVAITLAAPTIPVVVMTGVENEDLELEAMRQGAQEYHLKGNLDSHSLVRTIRFAIERNRAVQLVRQMSRSIDAAQEIQKHLLPSQPTYLPGFDIAGLCHPSEKCSGDFFDFIRMNGCLVVALADVAGHGFGPAMLAATVSAYLETAAALQRDIHEMLTVANWLIARRMACAHFVTLACAKINPTTRSLTYCSAGHPIYLLRASGRRKRLDALGSPLGVDEDAVFSLAPPVRLNSGDILLLMSDGVWEAQAGVEGLSGERRSGKDHFEQFGVDRALQVVEGNKDRSAAEIVASLQQAVVDFSHRKCPTDDVTIVVVKVRDHEPGDDPSED